MSARYGVVDLRAGVLIETCATTDEAATIAGLPSMAGRRCRVVRILGDDGLRLPHVPVEEDGKIASGPLAVWSSVASGVPIQDIANLDPEIDGVGYGHRLADGTILPF